MWSEKNKFIHVFESCPVDEYMEFENAETR